jgi:hypothetical protein
LKFISDTKWLSLITETYLEGLDAHKDNLTSVRHIYMYVNVDVIVVRPRFMQQD